MNYAKIPASHLSLPLSLLFAMASPAQVPDGWAVASRFRDANLPTAVGGLTILHPARPGLAMEVQGLSVELTGRSASLQINGASSVLVRPSDGALVVGEHVTGVATSVDIHLITLNGNQVAQDVRFTVGQVQSPFGYGWIDQMAWLPDGRVAFTQRGQIFNTGMPFSSLAFLDLGTGQISLPPILLGGMPNALTLSPDGATLFVGLFGTNTSRIAAVSVQTGAAQISPTMPGTILQLATDNDGSLLAGFTAAPNDLVRIDPGTWAATPVPGITDVNALALDPVSGNYIAYGLQGRTGVFAEVDRQGIVQVLGTVSAADSVPSGMALVPSMATYGIGSPSQNTYSWVLAPNPGGTPVLGNTGFGLTVASSPGTAPGALVVGTRRGNVPFWPGVTLWVDPVSIAGVFFLPPAATSTFNMPVPNDTAFLGFQLYAQNLHQEGAIVVGSEGLRLTAF